MTTIGTWDMFWGVEMNNDIFRNPIENLDLWHMSIELQDWPGRA